MKNNCDIVQDLLPLYLDGICSEGSRKFVEEHISECEKCSGTLSKLKNTEYDKEILYEKEKVIQYTYKKTKQKTESALEPMNWLICRGILPVSMTKAR